MTKYCCLWQLSYFPNPLVKQFTLVLIIVGLINGNFHCKKQIKKRSSCFDLGFAPSVYTPSHDVKLWAVWLFIFVQPESNTRPCWMTVGTVE
jgi:hypothetical protein